MHRLSVCRTSCTCWCLNNMPNTYLPTSRDDTAKILALVQEYAEKLRALSVAYLDARTKRQQILMMSIMLLSVATAALAFSIKLFLPNADLNSSTLPIIVGLIGVTLSVLPAIWIAPLSRSRELYDVHQVASTVERLLRTASQYSEHSAQTIGDKFEFDIRLAEAEAALHVYQNVFGDRARWLSGITK